MSETVSKDDGPNDGPSYTVRVNNKEYELNEAARERIESRARHEYAGNERFSCWWKTASDYDSKNSHIHEVGDPILVIETAGTRVPWENLDQLELEMNDVTSFQGFDTSSSEDSEGRREKSRTHFGITPNSFEEVPSPDGEDPDKVPAKPRQFDEPSMVWWIPDSPDIDHTWAAGEAMVSMDSWVEWNVQARVDQPRPSSDKKDSHDHWESILKMDDCQVVRELQPNQSPPKKPEKPKKGKSGSVKRKGEDQFENGKFGGSNWTI
jgi:hypothetical protein